MTDISKDEKKLIGRRRAFPLHRNQSGDITKLLYRHLNIKKKIIFGFVLTRPSKGDRIESNKKKSKIKRNSISNDTTFIVLLDPHTDQINNNFLIITIRHRICRQYFNNKTKEKKNGNFNLRIRKEHNKFHTNKKLFFIYIALPVSSSQIFLFHLSNES